MATPTRSAGTLAQKMVASRSVAALSTPPTPSIASLIAPRGAGGVSPPLNTMCSMKWASPHSAAVSSREPVANMKATLAEARSRIGAASSRTPPLEHMALVAGVGGDYQRRRPPQRPLRGPATRGTGGVDDHAARRLLARALGAHAVVVLQGEVDDAPLVRVHGVERVALAAGLDPLGESLRQLADLLLAAGPVALHVEDEAPTGPSSSSPIIRLSGGLQRTQRLTAPADQQPEVVAVRPRGSSAPRSRRRAGWCPGAPRRGPGSPSARGARPSSARPRGGVLVDAADAHRASLELRNSPGTGAAAAAREHLDDRLVAADRRAARSACSVASSTLAPVPSRLGGALAALCRLRCRSRPLLAGRCATRRLATAFVVASLGVRAGGALTAPVATAGAGASGPPRLGCHRPLRRRRGRVPLPAGTLAASWPRLGPARWVPVCLG